MARPAKKGRGSNETAQNRARLLNRLIFAVALFGMLVTVHLWIQSERGFSHGCFGFSDPAEVGIVECTAVVASDAGKLLGVISNIMLGFFFFGSIAALSFGSVVMKTETAGKLRKAALILATAGFAYALYLFFYQVFMLDMFCKLCLTTGLTAAVVFGLHAMEWGGKAVAQFELDGLVREIGLFILITLIAGLFLVADVFFVNHLGTLEPVAEQTTGYNLEPGESASSDDPGAITPVGQDSNTELGTDADVAVGPGGAQQVAVVGADAATGAEDQLAAAEVSRRLDNLCHYDERVPPIQNVSRLTSRAPFLGDETAEVAMVEFFDPNCPHCKTLHGITPSIMASVGSRAKLYYRPYPIWPYSYTQVEALYLADDAGLFHDMLDAQMERQQRGGLSIAELSDIAGDIGMNADQFRRDLNSGKHRSRVNRERAQVSRLGINSVPKLTINGRFVQSSSLQPQCIDHMVEKIELAG